MEEDNADKAAEQEAGDGSKPRNGIRSRWEKYKKEFAAQQVRPLARVSAFPSAHHDVSVHSSNVCLSTIGSRHGSQRSTTLLLNLNSFGHE